MPVIRLHVAQVYHKSMENNGLINENVAAGWLNAASVEMQTVWEPIRENLYAEERGVSIL